MQANSFPVHRFDDITRHPEDFKLLERVPLTVPGALNSLPLILNKAHEGEKLHSIVIIDTETTGKDNTKDKIIELGMVRLTFSMDRNILISIDSYYDEFEDPKMPIPQEVVNLTHITDDMVRDHVIDDDRVGQMVAGRPLIIAHNARFDRPLFDRRFPALGDLSWACSIHDVKWDILGYDGVKLSYLCQSAGFFYDAHRAFIDCLAVAWLLFIEPDALDMILNNALSSQYKILAYNSFDIKDKLKELGYSYNGVHKCWVKTVSNEQELNVQFDILNTMYNARDNAKCIKIGSKNKYKIQY